MLFTTKNNLKLPIILIVIVVIGGMAWWWVNNQQVWKNYQDYKDSSLGFSIKYPSGWQWEKSQNYDEKTLAMELKPGDSSCFILFIRSTPTNKETGEEITFKDLIAIEKAYVMQLSNDDATIKEVTEKNITINKVSSVEISYYVTFKNFLRENKIRRIFIPLTGHETFQIGYYDFEDFEESDCEYKFNQMLSTFKFIQRLSFKDWLFQSLPDFKL